MDNNETVELDGNTVNNIKVFLDKKAEFQKAIESVDGMIMTILNTVINVKGLTGRWELNEVQNLVRLPEVAADNVVPIREGNGKAD